MTKKTVKKRRKQTSNVKKALFIIALFALVWFGFGVFQDLKLNQAPPMDERVAHEPNIGNLIAPMVAQEDTFTLVFEDELPDPVVASDTVAKTTRQNKHQIALIIDDVGYDMKALKRLLALPYTITVSILPDAPYAKRAAQLAHQHGATVMLHMPMETANIKYQGRMEDFYLHSAMSKPIFTQVFEDALSKIPYVVGINNHMGSALTADKKSMQWLMELSKKHGLFFVDSRTSATSVGRKVAEASGITWNERDIFLDHSLEAEALQHAWQSALNCAQRNDHCVMLAHPHQETLAFLEHSVLPQDYHRFVNIKDTLHEPQGRVD